MFCLGSVAGSSATLWPQASCLQPPHTGANHPARTFDPSPPPAQGNDARAKAPGSPHPTDGGARVPVQGFLRHDGCHKGTAISEQHSRRSGGHDRPRPYLRGLSPPPQLVPTEPILPAQGTGRPSVRPCLGSHHMVVEWPPRAPARSEATERLEINPTRMPRRSWGR